MALIDDWHWIGVRILNWLRVDGLVKDYQMGIEWKIGARLADFEKIGIELT